MTATPGRTDTAVGDAFAAGRALFESLVDWLDGTQAAGLEHAELQTQLQGKGRELLRQLTQDHLACAPTGNGASTRSPTPTAWPAPGSRPGTPAR